MGATHLVAEPQPNGWGRRASPDVMKSNERQFGRQVAKALGEGPGPRAVRAQKQRVVAAADHSRRRRTSYWLALGIAGLVGSDTLLWLLLR
jgi:hypothetical protein